MIYNWSFETISNMTHSQMYVALKLTKEERLLKFETHDDYVKWKVENRKQEITDVHGWIKYSSCC